MPLARRILTFFMGSALLISTGATVSLADANETAPTSPNFSVQSSISYGHTVACLMLADKTVKCWGGNGQAQLGDGTTTNRLTAAHVKTSASDATPLANVSGVSAGANHVCAVLGDADKTVRCWGYNINGQLGNGKSGSGQQETTPVRVLTSGTEANSPVPLTGVVAISAGTFHTCAIKTDKSAWCWGGNTDGRLGNGTTTSASHPVQVLASGTASNNPVPFTDVVAISAGETHTCAIKADKSAWCWGTNTNYGALGDGTKNNALHPVQVLASGKTGGTTGADIPVPLTDVVAISADFYTTCAVIADGTLKCWGSNQYKRLGIGVDFGTGAGQVQSKLNPETVPNFSGVTAVSVGYLHACALKNDGTAWCWGLFEFGDLTSSVVISGSEASSSSPLQVSGVSNAVAVTVGRIQSGILTSTGVKVISGDNNTPPSWGPADNNDFSSNDIPKPVSPPDNNEEDENSSGGDNNSGGDSSGGGNNSSSDNNSDGGSNSSNNNANNNTGNTLQPGDYSAKTDGVKTDVEVDSNEEGTVTIKGDDFFISFDGPTNGGRKNELFLPQGGDVIFEGDGYKPNSRVTVIVQPGNIRIGSAVVGNDGTFTTKIKVPPSLKSGKYQVTINGTSTKGAARIVAAGADVAKLKKTTVKTFRVYSTKMRPKLRRQAQRIVKQNPTLTAVHCEGFVRPSKATNPKDIARATKRAKSTCRYLKKRKKSIHTTISVSPSNLNRRRVEVSYR